MCGQENKSMSVKDAVEDLTQACMKIRRSFESLKDRKDRERIVLQHIKEFANAEVQINDFRKGLEWFNVVEELSVRTHLAGKIVILDFFTYCCINCMHILPDLEALEKKYSIEDGLVVVGVHSAKFSNECDSKKILSAVQRYNIAHPVVNDAKLSMWRDIGIVCWPSIVILGPNGQLLATFVGEGHREEFLLYSKVALAYFKSLNKISKHKLPLLPSQHLLPSSKEILLFPGKIHNFISDQGEKLVVSDSGNNRILVMDVNGNVEYVIGGDNRGYKDGNFETARFNTPQGVCALNNSIYVADTENHAIRKIDLRRKSVMTVAGTGSQGHDYIGGKCGRDQPLSSPWDVAVYHHANNGCHIPVLLIAIAGTHQIWALVLEDIIWWKNIEYKADTCIAIIGNGREENRNNSYPHAASLAQPSGLAIAQQQKTMFFADSESSSIRKVDLVNGKVSALCGANRDPSNLHHFGDVDGTQFTAKLQHPLGVTWSPSEEILYIADTYNHKIKQVDLVGNCKTLYGSGKPNDAFSFDEPSGLAVSHNGDILYVADTNNHAIKAINLKRNTISSVPIVLPMRINNNENADYVFDVFVNAHGAELTISFDIGFRGDLKLNIEAPQRWSVNLPTDTWTAKDARGFLCDPVIITVPTESITKKLNIILDIIVCKTTECIPKRLSVVFNVHREADAPFVLTERKSLIIE